MKNKKKYLLYGMIALMLVLSVVIYKVTTSANTGDNQITIKSARIIGITTGTGDFTADNVVEDDEGNITSYTAGGDSSSSNRLVRSNDQLSYIFGYTIGGKNDTNTYYSRNVNITVELSEEEAKYVSFEENANPGETTHTYTFPNVSSTGGEYQSNITLFVLNGANNSQIAPKFTIKESTDTDAGVILGKNGTNIDYAYDNGTYTNTNRSTVANYMPTLVSSVASSNADITLVKSDEGQKATYNSQLGRFFTGVVVVSIPTTKGNYFSTADLSLPVSVTQSGDGTPIIEDNWVRLYTNQLVDTIDPVRVYAPYSNGDGGTANNETRFPGSLTYSGGTLNVTGIQSAYTYPTVTASEQQITDRRILGTYAISLFSPRTNNDGRNDVPVTLTVGSVSTSFTNSYYETSDYDLVSGFYDENGAERLTTYIDNTGARIDLASTTSKGSTITYKTTFNYKKTLSNAGLKEIIKVDPIAFRVIPKSDKEDIEIEVNCGESNCNISKDDFTVKYVTKDFNPSNYSVTAVDQRVSAENMSAASTACANLDLASYNSDQMMNIYGGPCIAENEEVSYNKINDSRDENDNEIPITKVVVQTKEGVVLPDKATVVVKVKLRVRNVADITRSYQAAAVASTSDTDSELYYYSPVIGDGGSGSILNPNNYIRSTFEGYTVLNSTAKYADSIRIVNFTARQELTATNKLSDGQIKTSYNVDENETIKYKLSTKIEDLNEQVGADDVWYFKSIGIDVNIPHELDYIPDESLGTPTVTPNGSGVTLHYELPWTKPNMKIDDIYFKTKLKNTLSGSRVRITVTASFNPININGEVDMSEINAKTAAFTIYGTGANTVLLSQENEGSTIVDRDTEFTYLLNAYNNTSGEVNNYVITDILPYTKDSRGSKINGNYKVKVVIPGSQSTAKLYCSTKDPKTYSEESNNSQDGFEECDANSFNEATAIRVTGIKLASGQKMDPIKVTLKPSKNKFSDKYVNNFIGGNNELKDRKSNDIEFTVISRTISGRVFKDANSDGIRNDGEELVSGMTVSLYKVDNGKLSEVGNPVTTDKNGEYKFKDLDAGLYKVRIEYNSGSYDLTLRYASENRATDSDAYKIKEGLAEISGKYAPNTIPGIDLTVFTNSKAENMDMGLIPRTTFGFEMKKYITQVDLNYNNSINTTKYNNQSTVALNVRNTLNATAKVYYGITIKNNSSQAGYVKLVQEDIPEGLTFDENDPYNKDWFKVGGILQSNVLADKLLQPGDTTYLQIALYMPNRETGNTFINTVSMMDIEEYVPQELAKEAEFETDTYQVGEEVSYAGVNWHVVSVAAGEDASEQIVTLLADSGSIPINASVTGTYSHGTSGVYRWSESAINQYINNDWSNKNSLNLPILKDQVVCNDASSLEGTSYGGSLVNKATCTSNEYVTTKVRLLTYEEYNEIKQAQLSDESWLYAGGDFWLQSAVNSQIEHDVYGRQTNPEKNNISYAVAVSGTNTSLTTESATSSKNVRPVITISSKNIIGQ